MAHNDQALKSEKFRVGIVSSDERQAVFDLRRQAYEKSAEFEWLDVSRLDWSEHDDLGAVLGVWVSSPTSGTEKLVASFRLSLFATRERTESFLEYSLHGVPPRFPTVVPSRSATALAYQRYGLHALMRNAYLRVAPAMRIESILTVVYDAAPRVASMLAVGYEAFACDSHWDSEATPKADPIIVSLPASRFEQALSASDQQVAATGLVVQIDKQAIRAALITLGR